MLNEVGRLCVKTAGRDANKVCVIVEVLGGNTVLIDGQTRRRKCNMRHLEPLQKAILLPKGASHADVKKAFEAMNLEVFGSKPKKAEARQKKAKVNKQGAVEKKEKKGRAPKKEEKPKKPQRGSGTKVTEAEKKSEKKE
jgi:large subunit ribosomal protein L14e